MVLKENKILWQTSKGSLLPLLPIGGQWGFAKEWEADGPSGKKHSPCVGPEGTQKCCWVVHRPQFSFYPLVDGECLVPTHLMFWLNVSSPYPFCCSGWPVYLPIACQRLVKQCPSPQTHPLALKYSITARANISYIFGLRRYSDAPTHFITVPITPNLGYQLSQGWLPQQGILSTFVCTCESA